MSPVRALLLAAFAAACALVAGAGAPAVGFDGEAQLYEAAKKEKEITWYISHYDSETSAALCTGFEKKYPGIKCNYVRDRKSTRLNSSH